MVILMIVLGWLVTGILAYMHKRHCDLGRHGTWTVGDREFFLPVCLLLGPIALTITLLVDSNKTPKQEFEEFKKKLERKNRSSPW